MRRRLFTLAVFACLLIPAAVRSEEPIVVASDSHQASVTRVAMTDSLHNGMVQPPTADEAFLLVYLETDDPCFDPARNADCFDGDYDDLETIAWACGEVEVTPEDIRPADGGGLLGGELACSYVVPIKAGGLVLTLRGYSAIDVEPGQ